MDDVHLRDEGAMMGAHGIDPVRYLESITRDTRSSGSQSASLLKLEKQRDRLEVRVAFHQRRSETHEHRCKIYPEHLAQALSDSMGQQASLSLLLTSLASFGLILSGLFVLFWDAWSGRAPSSNNVLLAAMTACGSLLLGKVQPVEHMPFFSDPRSRTLFLWGLPVLGSALMGILLYRSVFDPYIVASLSLFIALVMLTSGPALRSILLRIGPSLGMAYHRLIHRYHQYRMHRYERNRDAVDRAYAAQEHALEREIGRRQSIFLKAYDLGAYWARSRTLPGLEANGHVIQTARAAF